MEVVDTWQADAVRDTRTLSGGESFLVSLALALALSDLVSHKTRIDSCFLMKASAPSTAKRWTRRWTPWMPLTPAVRLSG